jgi:hypothetical protein
MAGKVTSFNSFMPEARQEQDRGDGDDPQPAFGHEGQCTDQEWSCSVVGT